jgi:hypothetical protein
MLTLQATYYCYDEQTNTLGYKNLVDSVQQQHVFILILNVYQIIILTMTTVKKVSIIKRTCK